MNSLRFRLILGISLVAVIPLAIAMILLSQRIQTTVRAQATDRLAATLGVLEAQLRLDGDRIAEKIEILGNDPALRRLFLVRPSGGRELSEYLIEKRFLLGLDFLLVADPSGSMVADGSAAPSVLTQSASGGWPIGDSGHAGSEGLSIESVADQPALVLSARTPIRYRGERAGVVRGGIALDAAFLGELRQTSGVDLVLQDADGVVVASTLDADPVATAISNDVTTSAPFLSQRFALGRGPGPHPTVIGLASTSAANETIAALRTTSLLLGLLGVVIAVVLGTLWSAQVSRPVERLAAFSERIAQGEWDEPLTMSSVRELQTLVSALDRMRGDLGNYRERLVASERQAAWSQMARKVAHEVKNPLTPIAVSVADLKRSFDQNRADFPDILDQAVKTIGEEVETLKRMLQAFSEFGRFPEPEFAACSLDDLVTDLRTLYGHEVEQGRLAFAKPPRDVTFSADRMQVRQAMVNLIKNALEAVNGNGRVTVEAIARDTTLEVAVCDSGAGMTDEQKSQLFVPNFTTKTHGSGLGLTIVERIVSDHHGTISVDTDPGHGTTFRIRLPYQQGA